MSIKVIYLRILALAIFTVFSSCMRTDTGIDINSANNNQKNVPVTANTFNAFSFTVDARSFDYRDAQVVQINTNTVSIAITVANFVYGSGKIIITDAGGATLYEKDLNGSLVTGNVIKLSAAPKNVTLNLSDFTGKVVVGLAGK